MHQEKILRVQIQRREDVGETHDGTGGTRKAWQAANKANPPPHHAPPPIYHFAATTNLYLTAYAAQLTDVSKHLT
jgi:hypothetical protein